MPIAPFTIQRRLETPFEENKYFSEAPLPTDIHLNLLEAFEAALPAQSADAKEVSKAKLGIRKFRDGDE